jgi:hypothetical protein
VGCLPCRRAVQVEVWDHNSFSPDELIGRTEIGVLLWLPWCCMRPTFPASALCCSGRLSCLLTLRVR